MAGSSGLNATAVYSGAQQVPSARYGSSNWVDLNGDFWIFGGYGFASGKPTEMFC